MPKGSSSDETPETPAESAEITESAATETTETEAATEVASTEAEAATEVADTEAAVEDYPADAATDGEATEDSEPAKPKRRINWSRVAAYGLLPGLALVLAIAAGYFKWVDNSIADSERVGEETVQVAKDSTIAMLSYKPDSVEEELNSARDLLTGEFRDSYTTLINDVVIPGAKEKAISAVASVPAAASVSADPNRAVVLVFVNQTVVVGQDPPTDTASSVRVTLDKVDDRWLISSFDPV
ncbi:hypothetical protein [Mycolicibacterium sp. XJ1819]